MRPKYLVRIDGMAEQTFREATAALDYASRFVYLPLKNVDVARWELEAGQTFRYAYGFRSVEIEATAKAMPESRIDACVMACEHIEDPSVVPEVMAFLAQLRTSGAAGIGPLNARVSALLERARKKRA